MLYNILEGFFTASPVTVEIRFKTGCPFFTALYTAIIVSTLSTIQPASAGSILEFMALPVVA